MPDYEKIAAGIDGVEGGEEPQGPADGEDILPEMLGSAVKRVYRVSDPQYQGLATEKGYSQAGPRIEKTRYSHEAMIDVIIAQPTIRQKELATMFGRSENWISRIYGSDAFQAALAKRKDELTDPFLVATIEERFNGLAIQSIDILAEKLEITKNADLAVKTLEISSKALGFGARAAGGNNQQNNFTIVLPQKAENSADWAQRNAPMKQLPGDGTNG